MCSAVVLFRIFFTSFSKEQILFTGIKRSRANTFFIFQINVTEELEKLYNPKPRDVAKKRMPKTFKMKRAQMNHLQTLREISEQQQQNPTPGTSTEKP